MTASQFVRAAIILVIACAARGTTSAQHRDASPALRGGTSRRAIHFTFDDGPDLEQTPRLLEELARRDVRATFFMLASKFRPGHPRSAEHIALAREIHRRGHTVASHNVTHVRMDRLSRADLRSQLDEGESLFRSLDVGPITLFRPPYGMMNADVLAELSSHRYTPLLWNINPRDYSERDAASVVRNFDRQIAYRAAHGERGGVVLLHDTLPWTREAFVVIHDKIVAENCRIVRERSEDELWDVVDDVGALSLEEDGRTERQHALRQRFESNLCPDRDGHIERDVGARP